MRLVYFYFGLFKEGVNRKKLNKIISYMGCTTTKSTGPLDREDIPALYTGEEKARALIERFNFDLDEFKFVKEIQDTYTELYGAFLLPDRVAGLVV